MPDLIHSFRFHLGRKEYDKLDDIWLELVESDADPDELLELAILTDRLDISEEMVRLRGHIEAFRRTLQTPEGVAGKRLEFLLQEMHRETNTVGSKTASLEISHLGVKMREEIERLREQVQNIE